MNKQDEKELFRVLAGLRKFTEWLDAKEADSVRYLKKSKDSAGINHHQGRVSLVDEIRDGIAAALRDK